MNRKSYALYHKSCALDPLPTVQLKAVVDIIAPFLTELFNRSLSSGFVPDVFKAAYITPLLKKSNMDPAMGGATGGGVWGEGVNVPLTFGTRGYRGRSNENDLCFYSRQFLFSTVQVTYISAFCHKTTLKCTSDRRTFQRNPCERIRYGTCNLRHKIHVP